MSIFILPVHPNCNDPKWKCAVRFILDLRIIGKSLIEA